MQENHLLFARPYPFVALGEIIISMISLIPSSAREEYGTRLCSPTGPLQKKEEKVKRLCRDKVTFYSVLKLFINTCFVFVFCFFLENGCTVNILQGAGLARKKIVS